MLQIIAARRERSFYSTFVSVSPVDILPNFETKSQINKERKKRSCRSLAIPNLASERKRALLEIICKSSRLFSARDCSLFIAGGGGGGRWFFNKLRQMKNVPLPESACIPKFPPTSLCQCSKFYPSPPQPSPSRATSRATEGCCCRCLKIAAASLS